MPDPALLVSTAQPDRLLPPAEASDYLLARWGIKRSVRTLQEMRRHGTGPAFRRGGNTVLYSVTALDRWVLKKFGTEFASTAEEFECRRVSAVTGNL
jgi:hypothetical protein